MSKESKQEARTITLDELLLRLEQLKQYMALLETRISEASNQLTELQLSKNTLENLPEQGGDGLVVLDRLSTIFIPVKIPEEWPRKILVNIGLNYYMRTDREKANDILIKRINSVRRTIQVLQKQYATLSTEYNALQQVLAQIYVQAQQAQRQTSMPGGS